MAGYAVITREKSRVLYATSRVYFLGISRDRG